MIRLFVAVLGYFLIAICDIELYATPPVIGKPWHQNTREHLFGFVDGNDTAYYSIEDEGFRWRNSFNFRINGNDIVPANWWFNKVVRFNPAPVNGFSDIDGETKIDYTNNASANDIHAHLAEIAWNLKNLNEVALQEEGITKTIVAAAAAITIVIEHSGQFYAFSKVLSPKKGAFVALNSKPKGRQRNLSYISINANEVRANLLNRINVNLPFPGEIVPGLEQYIGYGCSEGKILSMLVANNFSLFKSQIQSLLTQVRTQLRDETINCDSIHTIILHINTTMDPCAICTRCMVGLSKYLNEGQNIRSLQSTSIGSILSANFFIEVSSNDRYLGSNMDTIGSFTGYSGQSSHAECGGHDGQETTLINLQPKGGVLFPDPDNSLLVLPGGMKSWRFNNTFPPYIVFGRVNIRPPLQVTVVPGACATHRRRVLPPVQ